VRVRGGKVRVASLLFVAAAAWRRQVGGESEGRMNEGRGGKKRKEEKEEE